MYLFWNGLISSIVSIVNNLLAAAVGKMRNENETIHVGVFVFVSIAAVIQVIV